jgi:hypothetical protein
MTAAPLGDQRVILVHACIDFRFMDPLIDWLRTQGYHGQYDLRTHEGASLAIDRWVESAVAIDRLHDVVAVWIVDHDDCAAYRVAGEANTRENHVLHLKQAQARLQARLGKPVRVFFHPLGPDGRGAPAPEEIWP